VLYPKYVLEKLETGQISFSVTHPDFVPDRPDRFVNGAPPHGAPWKEWRRICCYGFQYRDVDCTD
jgi:hypothetical protein